MSSINPSDPTAAYLQIADALRRQIADGDLPDGAVLPSVRHLVDQFGTAQGTVRQAIEQLKAEGLIATRQGSGTFVRKPRRLRRMGSTRHLRSQRAPASAPLEAEATSQSFRRTSELTEVASVPAPPEVAERFSLPEGTNVLRRNYLLSINGEVAQTARSYFTHELADGTTLAEQAKPEKGTHAYLADNLRIPLDVAVEELVARMPTPQETMTLRLIPGTPVVELIRTIYDNSQNPVEVTVFVFAADRHSFVYEVPLD
ncbi:MAG: GntR family transcriptional regulator [Pseudonocardiaceae bacterium]